MIILFCILLFLWGSDQCCKADEYERTEFNKERRHREIMEQREKMLRTQQKKKRITRNYARDERGRFIAQEIIEEI